MATTRRPTDSPRNPEPLKTAGSAPVAPENAVISKTVTPKALTPQSSMVPKPVTSQSATASSVTKPAAKTAAAGATPTPRKPRAPRPKKSATLTLPATVPISEDQRRGMIAEGAYLRAERRGFAPGHEDQDWIAAEAEVNALLKARYGGTPQ